MKGLFRVSKTRHASAKVALLAAGLGVIAWSGFVRAAGLSQSVQPTSLSHGHLLIAPEAVPVKNVSPVDMQAVARDDEQRELAGLAPRFAIPNPVFVTPATHGVWENPNRDTAVWRLRISSPGALSLNLGFTRYFMPEGGRLLIYSSDLAHVMRPFGARDNSSHGELWTAVVLSDEIVAEVTIPAAERGLLQLELTSINVGYRGFGERIGEKSGSCNIDVVCSQGDAWWDEILSVGAISTGGSLFCSGSMVNNTSQDETPYFLTAYHCEIDSSNAASLVVYWNYETSSCGGTPDGSFNDFQTGSYFRAGYSPSDFTLVELDEDPDPAWGVTFAGWDRSGAEATTAVCIHHPSGDEKRISFEYDPTTTTSNAGTSIPGDGTHVRVADWDLGTTEVGSSGSPLFDQNHRVIGQLHGGYAACGNDLSDWFGRFSVSWNGGGTASSRLRNWLDPGNTGATSLDTLVPDPPPSGELWYSWNMDTDPGWTEQGLWDWGVPTGGGGEYGNPDPSSGYTGSNVYGYNLFGDYENNLPERHLTSTAIDCTDLSYVSLKFWRWLNVEHPDYDHAYVRVSNDGSSWTTVGQYPVEVTDSSWTQEEYNISSVADGESTVYLRWTMGSTDSSWRYSGWNIDDVEIHAVPEPHPLLLLASQLGLLALLYRRRRRRAP
jgi:hypothetical protein